MELIGKFIVFVLIGWILWEHGYSLNKKGKIGCFGLSIVVFSTEIILGVAVMSFFIGWELFRRGLQWFDSKEFVERCNERGLREEAHQIGERIAMVFQIVLLMEAVGFLSFAIIGFVAGGFIMEDKFIIAFFVGGGASWIAWTDRRCWWMPLFRRKPKILYMEEIEE